MGSHKNSIEEEKGRKYMGTQKLRDVRLIKTLTMIVAAFFVAAGLFMSNTLTVKAGEVPISEVHVNTWYPVQGNTNDHKPYLRETDKCAFDLDTSLFNGNSTNPTNVYGVAYHDENATYLKYGEKFKFGRDYGIYVALVANEDYVFDINTVVYINGTKANKNLKSEKKLIAYLSDEVVYAPFKKTSFEFDEPVVGQKIPSTMTITTNPEYVYKEDAVNTMSDISAKWTKTNSSGTIAVESWENVQPGYTYSLDIASIYAPLQFATTQYLYATYEGGILKTRHYDYYYNEDYEFRVNGELYGKYKVENNALEKGTYSFYAYETIKEASIPGLHTPVAGKKPSYSVSPSNSSIFEIFKDAGLGYPDGVIWKDLTTDEKLDKDSVFVEGHKYRADVLLKAKEGYYFTTSTAITCYGKPGTTGVWPMYEKSPYGYTVATFIKEFECVADKPVTTLNYVVDKPIIGEKPDISVVLETVPKDAYVKKLYDTISATNASSFWKYQADDGTWKTMDKDAVFEEGKTYGINVWAFDVVVGLYNTNEANWANETTGFADTINVTINGNKYLTGDPVDICVKYNDVYSFGKAEPKPTPTPTPTPTPEPTPTAPSVSPDGIAAEGTELASLDEAILAKEDDKDLPGAVYGQLQAKASKTAKKSVTLKWNTIEGADGYVIYGNKCGNANKYEKIKELTADKKSFTQKKLKKGTYYKYLVVAYKNVDGKQLVVSTSKTIHAATTGGKVGNAKSITIKNLASKKKTLKVGKKFTLKTKQVPKDAALKIKNHRKISYESSDKAVATVSSKGKIKAVAPGTCYIYVYAQNGVSTKVKIKVK